MRLRLAQVKAAALYRPPGYFEDVVSRGTIDGDSIEISDLEFRALQYRYAPPPPVQGLGDRLARMLHPLALFLDRRFGTKLTACPSCQRRRSFLNRLLPFNR